MAIKPIKISSDEFTKDYAQKALIRKDVKDALRQNVECFEFDGRSYNYDTLPKNAYLTIRSLFEGDFIRPAERAAKRKLKSENIEYSGLISHQKYFNQCFEIWTKYIDERTHVYCRINFERLDNLASILYEDICKRYRRKYLWM